MDRRCLLGRRCHIGRYYRLGGLVEGLNLDDAAIAVDDLHDRDGLDDLDNGGLQIGGFQLTGLVDDGMCMEVSVGPLVFGRIVIE